MSLRRSAKSIFATRFQDRFERCSEAFLPARESRPILSKTFCVDIGELDAGFAHAQDETFGEKG